MQYSVKGITFSKEDLLTVKLKDIRVDSVSPCHLFAFFKDRPILMLRAGDYVEKEFIDKYRGRGVESFHSLDIANPDNGHKYKLLFNQIDRSVNERQKRQAKDELVKVFAQDYWKKSDKSFLSFVSACFDEFYNLPEEVITELQTSSVTLYSRALLTSSICAMNCIIHSILDLSFIRDLYNASFLMDYGLVSGGDFNYLMSQACEKERNLPGSGLKFLEERTDALKESNAFFNHPIVSAQMAQKFKDSFTNPEVIEHIRFHHEKIDGSGFPGGLSYASLSDSETLLMFGDNMTPFEEHIFKRGDGAVIVKEAFSKLEELCKNSTLPIQSSLGLWAQAMDWACTVETLDESEVA
ncbi:MAG: hypothetical protein KC478_04745 [Bacteriovoracaceae bacterium]|nr:hypothetical protein [Bacteriovoracaceae bacterium]